MVDNNKNSLLYPDAPVFNPEAWNNDWSLTGAFMSAAGSLIGINTSNSLAINTNCYEYAVNANRYLDIGGDNPSIASGINIFEYMEQNNASFEEALIYSASADGAEPYVGHGLPPHRDGYYPVALFVREIDLPILDQIPVVNDYHWMRVNRDGTWSGTGGAFEIHQELNSEGLPIVAPHLEERSLFSETYNFSMYFYVPADGLRTGISGRLERAFDSGGVQEMRNVINEHGLTDHDEQTEFLDRFIENRMENRYNANNHSPSTFTYD